jgi:hypothetical protein
MPRRHPRNSSNPGHSGSLNLAAKIFETGVSAFTQSLCRLRAVLLVVLAGLSLTTSVLALEPVNDVGDELLPTDFSRVHFYLLTIDVGNKVWDNFGHTALRVVDESNNTDTVYNWGLFDISGGVVGFSFNFFKGIMNYQLGTSSPQNEFANYRQQQRSVWQDRINLNNQEKETLYKRLIWNSRAENVVYPYNYFFDNCTTRVRDYLDEALGGVISASSTALTPNTFRDLVSRHYESIAFVEFSLDVLMNSNIDRPISQWEEMFLPLSLRNRLMNLPSDVAVDGERQNLLSDSSLIMEFDAPRAQTNPYLLASSVTLLPLLLLYLLVRRVSMSYLAAHSSISLRQPELSYRLLGLLGITFCLFSGVFGLLMLGGWFFSGHIDLYNNVNLFLFWPTDLLGVMVAFRWLLFARPWPLTHNSTPFLNYYLLARVVSVVTYAIIAGFDMAAQQVSNIALFVAPGMFFFIILMWMVGFEQAKPKNMFV